MRVVSQERNLSIEFEQAVFSVQEEFISAQVYPESSRLIARYESHKRAMEVFEEMHKTYSGMPVILKNFDIIEDVQEYMRNSSNNGIIAHTQESDSAIIPVNNGVFYMPEE